jgi:threonine aldolase
MAEAEVGDDVYGEDPTVNRLQERAAEIFGKEAALFCPTGSMGNQIAVKLHTKPGDEIIIEERGHIFNWEMGSPAVIAGITIRPVRAANENGMLTWDEIAPAIQANSPYHSSLTGLICLENTHNFGGGSVMTVEQSAEIGGNARALDLPVHLDGARIFNAATRLNERSPIFPKICDSVQFCLSKGLGAPIGSMLLGKKILSKKRECGANGSAAECGKSDFSGGGFNRFDESPKRLHMTTKTRKLREGVAI